MTDFVNPQVPDQAGQAKYFNAFNLIGNIGPITFKKLLDHFNSLDIAWESEINEFYKAGLNQSAIEQIRKQRSGINPDYEIEKLEKEKIGLITIQDESYPKLLKEIYAPPAILYIKGNFSPNDKFSLGIVGTRNPSDYGRQITPIITSELSKSGITIVSGLAKGIDAIAHKTAIDNNGRTIAVLGSGIDSKSIYPVINKYLSEKITENGAVISEFPINTKPLAQNFPQRNRIISGLSLGILVIEASEKSGSMITARNALEQNREVFAIPGDILSNNSLGPNNLIKMGAKLVTKTNDILEELNL
ncbi:MAG: DNA-processing protein DprA [Patescibacteria group bacterium]